MFWLMVIVFALAIAISWLYFRENFMAGIFFAALYYVVAIRMNFSIEDMTLYYGLSSVGFWLLIRNHDAWQKRTWQQSHWDSLAIKPAMYGEPQELILLPVCPVPKCRELNHRLAANGSHDCTIYSTDGLKIGHPEAIYYCVSCGGYWNGKEWKHICRDCRKEVPPGELVAYKSSVPNICGECWPINSIAVKAGYP